MSLDEMLTSREPLELTEGVEKVIRFDGVEVQSLETRQPLVIRGPVDLSKYGPIEMRFTNARTGIPDRAAGIRFLVCSEDGDECDTPWNVLSKRVFTQLRGDLMSGAYLELQYGITKTGQPPRTKFAIRRLPPG